MKNKILNELLVIIILTVLLGLIIYFAPNLILRLILGLPVLILFPGYALLTALFPRKNALGGIEWMAYTLAVSIAVVSLIGIILNYTPWGITINSALIANGVFIVAAAAFAWCRRYRLADEERDGLKWHFGFSFGKKQSIVDRLISGILMLAILGAAVAMIYAYVSPETGEKFTEFYILGSGGESADYTKEMVVGEVGSIVIGIINREHETASYRVEVTIDGRENTDMGPVILADGEKWEEQKNYIPDRAGSNQKLEFYLYKNGSPEPYLKPLRIWLNVKSSE